MCQMAGIISSKKISHNPAKIFKKTFTLFRSANDPTCKDGQVSNRRISHFLLEYLVESTSPVLHSDLIAVNENIVQASFGKHSRFHTQPLAYPSDILPEMMVHRFGRKLVNLQPIPPLRGWMVAATIANTAHAKYLPIPDRDTPFQSAVFIHLRGQVENRILGDNLVFGRNIFIATHISAFR